MTDKQAEEVKNKIMAEAETKLWALMKEVDKIQKPEERLAVRKYVNALLNNVKIIHMTMFLRYLKYIHN